MFSNHLKAPVPTPRFAFYPALLILLPLLGLSGNTFAAKNPWAQTTIVQMGAELIFRDSFENMVTQSFVPMNQFNIGDSIGEGEAADGTIGSINHQTVWSTGYAGGDSVNVMNCWLKMNASPILNYLTKESYACLFSLDIAAIVD